MSAQGIYTGWVRHRRFAPVAHAFRYRLCMLFLDVERVHETLGDSWLHSARRAALLRYRREDFLGDPQRPLADCVRDLVAQQTGRRPAGPVMLLANLRWFGLLMNPIACYYCYEADGSTLAAVVAEVTNTPWDERHAYVLPAMQPAGAAPGRDRAQGALPQHFPDAGDRPQHLPGAAGRPGSDRAQGALPQHSPGTGGRPVGARRARDPVLRARFAKALHVSPFNPMDMEYRWSSCTPGERLAIHLENHRDGAKVFDATLGLRREPLTRAALSALLAWRYPLMTLRIAAAIHVEALRLLLKRVPFHPNPRTVKRPEEATG